jgi:hypothetical protein
MKYGPNLRLDGPYKGLMKCGQAQAESTFFIKMGPYLDNNVGISSQNSISKKF